MGKNNRSDVNNRNDVVNEVHIGPLEARREALAVCGMIFCVILLMTLRFSIISGSSTRDTLKSYQRFDAVLESQDPILYRSLLSAVGDITDLRLIEGDWPEVEDLISESIPPFADDFLPMGLKNYTWTRHASQGWVDYYGTGLKNAETEKISDHIPISLILRVIDLQSEDHPHPHIGLDNDTKLKFSVQVWMYPEKRPYPEDNVVQKGWKWIISANDPFLNENKEISEKPVKD